MQSQHLSLSVAPAGSGRAQWPPAQCLKSLKAHYFGLQGLNPNFKPQSQGPSSVTWGIRGTEVASRQLSWALQ